MEVKAKNMELKKLHLSQLERVQPTRSHRFVRPSVEAASQTEWQENDVIIVLLPFTSSTVKRVHKLRSEFTKPGSEFTKRTQYLTNYQHANRSYKAR